MANSSESKKFPELEGLRGVCAAIVFLSHWYQFLPRQDGVFAYFGATLAAFTAIAVIVFFILSGFVIGCSVKTAPSRQAVKTYLLKRFIRLYPIYLGTLIFSFWAAGVRVASPYFVLHALFLQNMLVPTIESNGPLWSLNNEVCYYLVFVIAWIYPRSLIVILCAAIIGVVCATFDATTYFNLIGLFTFWLFGLLLSRYPDFLKNIVVKGATTRFWLAFFCIGANMSTGAPDAILKQIGANAGLTCMTAVNAALIFDVFLGVLGKKIVWPLAAPFYVISAITTVVGLAYGIHARKFGIMENYPVAAVYAGLAIFAWIFPLKGPSRAQWSAIAGIGGISYALYVVHFPILVVTRYYFPGSWLAIIATIPLVVAISVFLEGLVQPRIRAAFFSLFGGESRQRHTESIAAPADKVRLLDKAGDVAP